MKGIVLFFALFLSSCAVKVPVAWNLQESVERIIDDRWYEIYFTTPPTPDVEIGFITGKSGLLWMMGDTLKFRFDHPAYESEEKYLIQDYRQSKTPLGEFEVCFFVMRYDKKQQKEVRMPFYFKIHHRLKVEVKVDGKSYNGELGSSQPNEKV